MKVSGLMDILKKADPNKEVFVMDNHAIYSAQSVEIAETGNLILNFDNWYNECIANWLTKPIGPLEKDENIKISEGVWQYDIYFIGNWHDIPTICSKCGHKYTEYVCGYEWEETGDLPNFCPHCGAKITRSETYEELKKRSESKEE